MSPALPLPTGRWSRTTLPDTATPLTLESAHGVPIVLVAHHNDDAPPPPINPAVISGLDHVVVRSPNPDRALALYGARLGLDLRLDRTNPEWESRLLFFRCGDLVVEIVHGLKAGRSEGSDHLWGLSWRVPDAESVHARLSAAGIEVSEIRSGRRPGTRVFTVRDRATRVPTLVLEAPGPSP